MVCDVIWCGCGQVCQHDDRQLVIHVARDVGREALPCALVLDHAMSVRVVNEPSETVAVLVRFPIAELYRRPHQIEAFGFKQFSCSQGRIPLSEILDGKIETAVRCGVQRRRNPLLDRKSTRLNSSHMSISYAVFCLKKKR